MRILVAALWVVLAGCQSMSYEQGDEKLQLRAFGQVSQTIVLTCDEQDHCRPTEVKLESAGLSENGLLGIGSVVSGAASVFGGGGTTIIMPGADED